MTSVFPDAVVDALAGVLDRYGLTGYHENPERVRLPLWCRCDWSGGLPAIQLVQDVGELNWLGYVGAVPSVDVDDLGVEAISRGTAAPVRAQGAILGGDDVRGRPHGRRLRGARGSASRSKVVVSGWQSGEFMLAVQAARSPSWRAAFVLGCDGADAEAPTRA